MIISHAVTLKSASVSASKITIAAGGTLTVDSLGALMASNALTINGGSLINNGGTINIGTSGGDNKTFTLSTGTLNLAKGIININGNIVMSAGSFTMTGGSLNIDPNNGVATTSVAAGTDIFNLASAVTTNVSAGTITFVDPPFSGNAESFAFAGSNGNRNWQGNTMVFGGTTGINTNAGATNGFNLDTRSTGSSYILLGDVVVNGGAGINRFVSGSTVANNGFDIGGNLVINLNSQLKTLTSGAVLRIKGDIINNGTLTDLAGISFSQRTGSNTVLQTVSGTGKFLNAYNTGNLNAPFFTNLEFDNIAKPIAVKFAVNTSNPNIYITGNVAFNNGVISLPEINHMYFMETATATRKNGFMLNYKGRAGQMSKLFGIGASKFTFHIGDNTGDFNYTPATLEYTANSQARWMGVRVEDGDYAYLNNGSTAKDYLNRYFDVYGDLNGTWNANFTFTYLNEDVIGSTTNMKYGRWNGSTWEQYTSPVTANTFSYTFNQSTLIRYTKAVFTGRGASSTTSTARTANENTSNAGKTKVSTLTELVKAKVSVFPNPVRDGNVNIQLSAMPAGKYTIAAYSNVGQLIYSKSISYSSGLSTEVVALPANLANGVYTLVVNDTKKQISRQNILVQK